MKLTKIQIKNYRSIDEISFDIEMLEDGSYTYSLIGINEAGKSSILKAIALTEFSDGGAGLIPVSTKDFRNGQQIEVNFFYEPTLEEIAEFQTELESLEPIVGEKVDFSEILLKGGARPDHPSMRSFTAEILNLEGDRKAEIEGFLRSTIIEKRRKAIFWTAEDRYLITLPVDLTAFATDNFISIPLRNCFLLAGITDISGRINSLANDSTEIEQLEKELGEKVTGHIKEVWPDHPIVITFKINNNLINFHVKDVGDSGKAKTADQRSDGFKQFISFLLSVSAQGKNGELSNSILLLDEPETHLYPEAQEYLLEEMMRITKTNKGNIVFFATHSIFMIDKTDLSRNYKVTKKINTIKERFQKGTSTYASIIYKVFGISNTEYHIELYSILHARYQDADATDDKRGYILSFDSNYLTGEKGLKKDKPWKGTANQATLPTYIRNCIDHPDNGNKYTKEELKKSIALLESFL